MAPHSMPQVDPKSSRDQRRAIHPMTSTGSSVSAKPRPIHIAPSGRMTVSKKCAPASSPRQARYIDSPMPRSIRLALSVV